MTMSKAYWSIFLAALCVAMSSPKALPAARETRLAVPLVARLAGTNVELGQKILSSPASIIPADDLDDAAEKMSPQ